MKNATVIGAVNIDITGIPQSKLSLRDSNIGSVKTTIGGVGANIAQNLALMGIETEFISAIGDDPCRNNILKRFDEVGIDYQKCLFAKGYECGKYLSILDENNDMICGINHMKITELLNREFFSSFEITNEVISADCNLSEEAFEYILTRYGKAKKIIVDAVSMKKAMKILPLCEYISVFRPNKYELGAVTGREIKSSNDIYISANELIKRGIRQIYVTDAGNAVYAFDESGGFELKVPPAKAVNTTGAGDCFTSAVIKGLCEGLNLTQTAQLAISASAINIKSINAVNDDIRYLRN